MKRAQFLALFFALICSVIYFSLAALFKLGATLLIHNTTTLEDILLYEDESCRISLKFCLI